MMQARHAFAGLARRLLGGQSEATAAVATGIRHISGSSAVQHVQAAPVDDSPEAGTDAKPRWRSELGAVRTDWT